MDASTLLLSLRARGVSIGSEAGQLLAGPPHLLTDGDRAALRAHKPELLALLASGPLPPASDPSVPSADALRHLAGYVRDARWLLGSAAIVVRVLHQEYAKDAAREGVQPVPLEEFARAYEAEPVPPRNACRDDKEALVLIEEPAATQAEAAEKAEAARWETVRCDNVTTEDGGEPTRSDAGGNSASYRIRRLKRDRPGSGVAA